MSDGMIEWVCGCGRMRHYNEICAKCGGERGPRTIVVNQGESVQDAIDRAEPGDVVTVRPGVVTSGGLIRLRPGVTLQQRHEANSCEPSIRVHYKLPSSSLKRGTGLKWTPGRPDPALNAFREAPEEENPFEEARNAELYPAGTDVWHKATGQYLGVLTGDIDGEALELGVSSGVGRRRRFKFGEVSPYPLE